MYTVSVPIISRCVIVYESPVSRNLRISPTLIRGILSALSCVDDSNPENVRLSVPIE